MANGLLSKGGGGSKLKEYPLEELWLATGGFHKLCLIGEGGFGPVYRAMVQLTPVAIKVLDEAGMQGMREYHTETQLLSSLCHPGLVALLGYATQQGQAEPATRCLVYELMSHGNLEDCLAHRVPGVPVLPWPQRVQVAAQAAGALAYLHAAGVVHRDVKPANIFLDARLNAKLGDIGLAAVEGYSRAGLRRAGSASEPVGTYQYLAPEYKTNGRSSPRTDVYALGLVLLQLVTAVAQPRDLIRRCQTALEDCTLPQMADQSAGSWDMRVCERLVKLALWCCMHDEHLRPHASVVHSELQRVVLRLQQQGLLSASDAASAHAGAGAR